MAHIGSIWKLARRRDFNLNLKNNRTGWANRYIGYVSWPPFVGIPGVISGVIFDVGGYDDSDPNQLSWTSDPKLVGTFIWTVELVAQIANNTKFITLVNYLAAGHGAVFTLRLVDGAPGRNPGFFYGTQYDVVFANPEFFDFVPDTAGVSYRPKDWFDPPPH